MIGHALDLYAPLMVLAVVGALVGLLLLGGGRFERWMGGDGE